MTTSAPIPTSDELRWAYRVAVRNRSMDERVVRLLSQGKVKFAIYGPGEEIHGTATALAWHKATGGQHFAFGPHYRSGTFAAAWCELLGRQDFVKDVIRQQLSRSTDPFSGGRQMVNHLVDMERGILPAQSPLGMNLGKTAGYAKALRISGVTNAFVAAAVGDGSTAEIDMHDAMNAVSVWDLPMAVMVTDNGIAISTRPKDGRGIKDFEAYARAFGLAFFACDGKDWWSVYETAFRLARHCIESQTGALWHVHGLPRLNGHSSAGSYRFDLEQPDPIRLLGDRLVQDSVFAADDVLRRVPGEGADFFAHHELGRVMAEEDARVAKWFAEVEEEPHADAPSIWSHIRPPLPNVQDPADLSTRPTTNVTYAGALRAAMKEVLSRWTGAIWGQDVARLGGVMQATAGLRDLFPDRVIDAPINEPLTVGTAVGAGLLPGFRAIPEIQFGDYSLNAYHWLVYMGNLYWSSLGQCQSSVILRMPTDPFGGGAIYHSMSVDGFFTPIPGLVIVMPSTSYDAYGLLLSAAEYGGPVVFLEPKYCYRRTLGPAFPDEPQERDKEGVKALRDLVRRGGIPDVGHGVRVPLGKAIVRRPGRDLTLVGWGRGAIYGQEVAATLAEEGVSIEVIDLRTLVPLDMDTILESVQRTGRLVVAADDRTFAGFHREIEGQIAEALPGLPMKAVGMANLPGIPQCEELEEVIALDPQKIEAACRQVLGDEGRAAAPAGWNWVPSRYLVG
jgi:2-oxoisovalerate dehydrogenase E1 component